MPGDLRWPVDTPPSDMLARVQGRADALRRRRRMVMAGAPIPVLVLIALLVALTFSPAGPGSNVRTDPAGEGKGDRKDVRIDPKTGALIPGGDQGQTGPGGATVTTTGGGPQTPPAGTVNTVTTLGFARRDKPRGGRVGFIRDGAVMSMKRDGSDVRGVTRPGVRADSFDWSPDGSRVVLEVHDPDSGASEIAVVDDDGGNYRVVARMGVSPRWSPDGALISFTRQVPTTDTGKSSWGVFTVRPDGSGERLLLDDAQAHAWSPDGRRLVYQCHSPREICVGAADGSSETVLSVGSGDYPAWSPDGGRIAMYQTGRIVTFKPDGSDSRLIHPEYTGRTLSWSPDSQWLASRAHLSSECPAGDCGTSGITLLRASGSGVERLTSNAADDAPVFERA